MAILDAFPIHHKPQHRCSPAGDIATDFMSLSERQSAEFAEKAQAEGVDSPTTSFVARLNSPQIGKRFSQGRSTGMIMQNRDEFEQDATTHGPSDQTTSAHAHILKHPGMMYFFVPNSEPTGFRRKYHEHSALAGPHKTRPATDLERSAVETSNTLYFG